MFDIQITGEFPQVNTDLSGAMERAMEIMLASVKNNLADGGRPQFNVKHPNGLPLFGTGKMYSGVMGTSDARSATVYMDSSVVSKPTKNSPGGFFYPKSLNDGAEIREVLSSEHKLMVFEIDGHTVFTYHRKGYTRPAFPFMIFQEEDKEKILNEIKDAVFIQQGERLQ